MVFMIQVGLKRKIEIFSEACFRILDDTSDVLLFAFELVPRESESNSRRGIPLLGGKCFFVHQRF